MVLQASPHPAVPKPGRSSAEMRIELQNLQATRFELVRHDCQWILRPSP